MTGKDSIPHESAPEPTIASGISIPRELIDALPEDKRQELLAGFEQHIIHVRSEEHYTGPDVHPDIAARWEDVLPGSAKELFELSVRRENNRMARQDRILTVAEELSKHKISHETQAHQSTVERDLSIIATIANRERRGQWFGFVAVIAITAGGFLMIHLGHDAAGIGVLIVEAAGVAGIFAHQLRHSRSQLARVSDQSDLAPTPPSRKHSGSQP